MKIVLISHGNFAHIFPYLDHLCQKGDDVHWLQIAPGRKSYKNVKIYECFQKSNLYLFKKFSYILSVPKIRKLLRFIQPDVINAHYASSAGVCSWLSNQHPYVVTVHGSDIVQRSRNKLSRFLLKKVFHSAALINPVGQHLAVILKKLGIDEQKIFPLTLGVPLDQLPFLPRRWDNKTKICAVCTRTFTSSVYDMPTILQAFAELKRNFVPSSVSFPATGILQPECRSLAKNLGIEEVVTFGNGYTSSALPEIMHKHNIYLSASKWDGISLSLLEAMASGLFPIISDIPANREWVTNGENGFLFPVGDGKYLANLLQNLHLKTKLIDKAIAYNRSLIEKKADQDINLGILFKKMRSLSCTKI
jgi:L-malate glycosyltransferase